MRRRTPTVCQSRERQQPVSTGRTPVAHARGSDSACAFMLLELLVALTIAAVLMLALYTAMGIGFRARASLVRQSALPRQTALVLDMVQEAIQSALPPAGVLAGPFVGSLTSTGAATTLTFSAAGTEDPTEENLAKDAGIHAVTLELSSTTAPAVLSLTLDRNPLIQSRNDSDDPVSEVLSTRVSALTLRYYDGWDWLNEWDSSTQDDTLPLAVEVTLELQDRGDPQRTCRMVRLVPLSTGRAAGAGVTGGVP